MRPVRGDDATIQHERAVKFLISAQVCALEKERERNLHACDAFVVNVDTKWSTHGPFEDDRATCRPAWKSTSVSGADAADLARSSGEEPASPRHRAGVASMAYRTTRRLSTNAP